MKTMFTKNTDGPIAIYAHVWQARPSVRFAFNFAVLSFALLILLTGTRSSNGQARAHRPPKAGNREQQSANDLGRAAAAAAQSSSEASGLQTPVRSVPDPGVITTNQVISPAGVQSVFESRVLGIAFGASSNEVYAATNTQAGALVYQMDWRSNRVVAKLTHAGGRPGMQGLIYDPVSKSVLMTAVGKSGVELVKDWNGSTTSGPGFLGSNEVAGVAVSRKGAPGTHYAVVALTFDNQAVILDLGAGRVLSKVHTGVAPFGVVIDQKNRTAYVSNWAGRFPKPGDVTATTGSLPHADRVKVDSRGVAASGTVSQIDLNSGSVIAEIEVGLHPAALALDDARSRLYVANSNSDTITVIDTVRNKVVDSILIEPFMKDVAGISPEALALSADGEHLYVACSGINSIAVLGMDKNRMKIQGLIPTGWYPNAIALSPDGKFLGVSTLLGVGSGWKSAPIDLSHRGDYKGPRSPTRRYVHSYRGTIHVIEVPDKTQLRRDSIAVSVNNHMILRNGSFDVDSPKRASAEMPVPLRAGDPSPIKHIVYIIKENRSYDQFFGALGKGNGDPSLQVYSEREIPNQRRLAKEFVLLDNFYVTGGNSGDGHQWVTQANETDYTYWAGNGGRSYPFGGDDPMAVARGGFIWDAAAEANKSFIDFGEYAGYGAQIDQADAYSRGNRRKLLEEFKAGMNFDGRFSEKAATASLNKYLVKDYPAWTLDVPDVVRAQIFISHLKQWEALDDMPSLVMAQLPGDHTAATVPGFSTPKACMADNDYAVGMVVDALSHTKFWKSTLILIVEDDAQDGLDHVDGHRSVALAISPYIKRGSIDSTFYSQPSMIKTIELILGMKTMSLFDLIANDMRNSFQDKPDLSPYNLTIPEYSLLEENPSLKALSGQELIDARASLKMDFRIPDAAPTARLNRILWRDTKGAHAKYPKAKRAVFAPYATDLDDDEKDEMKRRR